MVWNEYHAPEIIMAHIIAYLYSITLILPNKKNFIIFILFCISAFSVDIGHNNE